jgi:hypothetical protein
MAFRVTRVTFRKKCKFAKVLGFPYRLPQRFTAARRAISARRSGVIFAARAFPPRLPSSAAALLARLVSNSSLSSPVAIRMTLTAAPITSAGRFSPRGPFGMLNPSRAFR